MKKKKKGGLHYFREETPQESGEEVRKRCTESQCGW